MDYMKLIEDFVSEDLISGEGLPKIDSEKPQRLSTGMPKPKPKIYKRAPEQDGGGDTNVSVSMPSAAGVGDMGGEEPEIEIQEPEQAEEPQGEEPAEPEADVDAEPGEGEAEDEEEPQ